MAMEGEKAKFFFANRSKRTAAFLWGVLAQIPVVIII